MLTTPLALVGLASIPALVAIYYLRTRSRLHPVSSLLLWTDSRAAPEGGRRLDERRLPLSFWLELLALLLLVMAAVGLRVPAAGRARPLVVVLDDSFSMQAGAPDSARKRAADALLDDLRRTPRPSVRLVLAGDLPQVLGEPAAHRAEVEALLEGWACQAATARLDSAVALALQLGGDSASVLVLTDHAPDPAPTGRVRWWSLGSAAPNWAFVNANRTPGPRGDRFLLEFANLAGEPRSTALRVEAGEPSRELHRVDIRLNAGDTHRLVLEVPAGAGAVRAAVGDDTLSIDNAVMLLTTARRSITYELRLGDRELRAAAEKALKATGAASPAEAPAQLVFLDGEDAAPAAEDTWVVRVLREPDAEAYTGPFVIDRAHPLTDGLALSGVVWGGGKSPLPGAPVVMAGNVPLLTDSETATGRHEIRLRLRPDLSTLTQSPAWPSLMWNLAHWRAAHLPGLDRANVRLGEEAVWTLTGPHTSVEVTRPGGGTASVPVHARRAAVRAERPGVYSLKVGDERGEFAANALNRDESDLTKCVTGRWGEELDESALRSDYRDATAWLALAALAILAAHAWLLTRRPGGAAT